MSRLDRSLVLGAPLVYHIPITEPMCLDSSFIHDGCRYFDSVQIIFKWGANAVTELLPVHTVVRVLFVSSSATERKFSFIICLLSMQQDACHCKASITGCIYARHARTANRNTITLSLMLRVGSEDANGWKSFDNFLHEKMPSLRQMNLSIVMYVPSCMYVLSQPYRMAALRPMLIACRDGQKGIEAGIWTNEHDAVDEQPKTLPFLCSNHRAERAGKFSEVYKAKVAACTESDFTIANDRVSNKHRYQSWERNHSLAKQFPLHHRHCLYGVTTQQQTEVSPVALIVAVITTSLRLPAVLH